MHRYLILYNRKSRTVTIKWIVLANFGILRKDFDAILSEISKIITSNKRSLESSNVVQTGLLNCLAW